MTKLGNAFFFSAGGEKQLSDSIFSFTQNATGKKWEWGRRWSVTLALSSPTCFLNSSRSFCFCPGEMGAPFMLHFNKVKRADALFCTSEAGLGKKVVNACRNSWRVEFYWIWFDLPLSLSLRRILRFLLGGRRTLSDKTLCELNQRFQFLIIKCF